MSEKQFSTNN